MRRKRVTILDVAAAAGVDNSTVSLALRHDPRITPATRERIQAVAAQLNYVPNSLARALSGGRSRMIGIMLTGMEGQFFVPFLETFYAAVEGSGLSLSVQFSSWDAMREERAIERFCEMRAEGVIWAATLEDRAAMAQLAGRLKAAAVPVVMLGTGRDQEAPVCHEVGISTEAALEAGIAYLKGLGHRRIGLVSADALPGSRGELHRSRLVQTRCVMAAAGLALRPEDVWSVADNEYGAVHMAASFAARPVADRPTAIFALDDMLARGLAAGLQIMDVSIPEAVSVLGYDDAPLADQGGLGLSTVSLRARDHAQRAMDLLLQVIDGKVQAEPCKRVRLQPSVVERQSCAGLPGGAR